MFTPLLPGTSLTSWMYLKDNQAGQLDTLSQDAMLNRENSHFAERIAGMSSVDELMNDYLALKVALGAHGLQDDLPNKYFVQQVIEQGTGTEGAFANRLSDARYTALAQTFEALGLTGSDDLRNALPAISNELSEAVTSSFGDSPLYLSAAARLDNTMTLGMLGADTSDKRWQRAADDDVLAPVLRKMLGVSGNAAALDAEGQATILREATGYVYGENDSLSALIDPGNAFAVADAYLGTAGAALEDAFSYNGLSDRFQAIFDSTSTDADQWSALQADGTLRDLVASVMEVPAGFAGMSAADQITALQDATESFFGRRDFSVFAAQANLTELGDRHLSADVVPLSQAFTLGGFVEQVTAVRDVGASVEESWESVLSITANRTALVAAYGLDDDFASKPLAEQIDVLRAETLQRFGSDSPEVFQTPDVMASLTGLYMDAQIQEITDQYVEEEYRVAVGEIRPELRVALSVAEELSKAISTGGTEDGQWFRVLGSSVLREAFEGAFGLPSDFGQTDLDGQARTMKKMSNEFIGSESVSAFLDPENQEKLITRYLASAGTSSTTVSSPTLSLFSEGSSSTILATIYSQG